MKVKRETIDFIEWYLKQLCNHKDSCILVERNLIVCLRCMLNIKIPEEMIRKYEELTGLEI
jgi:hypothetical protein